MVSGNKAFTNYRKKVIVVKGKIRIDWKLKSCGVESKGGQRQ